MGHAEHGRRIVPRRRWYWFASFDTKQISFAELDFCNTNYYSCLRHLPRCVPQMGANSYLPVYCRGEIKVRSYTRTDRLITVSNLNLQYGEKKILRDINLTVDDIVRPNLQQGQTIALLGASGVGKTQLFRCMAGLQQPSSGSVVLDGKTTPVKAGDVGVVFQNYPLLLHRTVWGNLKLAASKMNVKDNEIISYLDRFHLMDKKDLYPHQLSGGQRQRVAIIQQMLCSEHVVLMDEPFSGLDVRMKSEVCKIIKEISIVDERNTTINTTHDIETAVKVADTVWVLGFQKDTNGAQISGAVIRAHIDLIERGIAWQDNPELHSSFSPTVREITQMFMNT